MQQRIVAAALFGISAVLASLQVNGLPSTREGWLGVGGVFMVAAWGKFSSSTTLLAADREVWTTERRTVEAPPPGK
jgi:hypothetical protein